MNSGIAIERFLPKKEIQRFLNYKDFDFEIIYSFKFLINDLRQIFGRIKKGEKYK